MNAFRAGLQVIVQMVSISKNNPHDFYCNSKILIPHPQPCSVLHQSKKYSTLLESNFDINYRKIVFLFQLVVREVSNQYNKNIRKQNNENTHKTHTLSPRHTHSSASHSISSLLRLVDIT